MGNRREKMRAEGSECMLAKTVLLLGARDVLIYRLIIRKNGRKIKMFKSIFKM